MAHKTLTGRSLLDLPGVADRLGVVPGTVSHWRHHRQHTHFPPHVRVHHRAHWWDTGDIDAWWSGHQATKRARLTTLDRGGHPDDLIHSTEAARILGYTSARNLTPAFLRLAHDSEPAPNGGRRRRWRRSTVWAYADSRCTTSPSRPGAT